MNTAGDAADQVVRYSLEAGEVALKLTGEGAKELAVLLYTILKEEKKTTGKAKLETLIRSGKPLTVFSVKKENMEKFQKEAKKYGIMYYPIPNSEKDGLYDIMVKEEDAPRINRLVERFKLTTVSDAPAIKKEIQKSQDAKAAKDVPNQERPEKSADDKLVDELLGEPMKKEERSLKNPEVSKGKNVPPSENTFEKQSKNAEGTSKKAESNYRTKGSIREELNRIKQGRANPEVNRPVQEQRKEQKKPSKTVAHTQPKSKKKSRKGKAR